MIEDIASVGLTIFFVVMLATIITNMDNWGKK